VRDEGIKRVTISTLALNLSSSLSRSLNPLSISRAGHDEVHAGCVAGTEGGGGQEDKVHAGGVVGTEGGRGDVEKEGEEGRPPNEDSGDNVTGCGGTG